MKSASLKNTKNFCIGRFWSVYVKCGECGKSSRGGSKTLGFDQGLTMLLTKVWPQLCVDLIKKIICDCWLGFRDDAQVDQGLTEVNVFDPVISTNDAD
jgi:hypothetical protein